MHMLMIMITLCLSDQGEAAQIVTKSANVIRSILLVLANRSSNSHTNPDMGK